jgi:ribosomal-protein-alanine N-acetyltransferase
MNPAGTFAGGEVHVRRMNAADLDRVVELAESLESAPHWPRPAYLAALDPSRVPQGIALVAEDESTREVVGFLVASLLPPQAELESIAVAAAGQRRGLGKLLFAYLLTELNRAEIREIILEVRASNRQAMKFYQAHGFIETARRKGYYADPIEDAVLLARTL